MKRSNVLYTQYKYFYIRKAHYQHMYNIIRLYNTQWNSYIRLLVFTYDFKAELVHLVSVSFTDLLLIQKKTIRKVILESKTDI